MADFDDDDLEEEDLEDEDIERLIERMSPQARADLAARIPDDPELRNRILDAIAAGNGPALDLLRDGCPADAAYAQGRRLGSYADDDDAVEDEGEWSE